MSDKTKALLWRALLGLVIVELPVLTVELQRPVFDYRVLAVGLLGAAAGWLEKNVTFSLQPGPIIVIPPEPMVDAPARPMPPIPPAAQNPNVDFPGMHC